MATGAAAVVDPRVLRTRRVVREAVLAELAEAGYGGLTVESVAARAGVGKSTIYRHWAAKATLVAYALEALNVQPEPRPAGPPRQQVEGLLRHLAEVMADSPVAACLPALIDASERDETIRALHHGYSKRRREALRAAIHRGVAEGQFRPHVDPDLAAQALAGAIVYRRVMTGAALTADDVAALVTTVLGPPDE